MARSTGLLFQGSSQFTISDAGCTIVVAKSRGNLMSGGSGGGAFGNPDGGANGSGGAGGSAGQAGNAGLPGIQYYSTPTEVTSTLTAGGSGGGVDGGNGGAGQGGGEAAGGGGGGGGGYIPSIGSLLRNIGQLVGGSGGSGGTGGQDSNGKGGGGGGGGGEGGYGALLSGTNQNLNAGIIVGGEGGVGGQGGGTGNASAGFGHIAGNGGNGGDGGAGVYFSGTGSLLNVGVLSGGNSNRGGGSPDAAGMYGAGGAGFAGSGATLSNSATVVGGSIDTTAVPAGGSLIFAPYTVSEGDGVSGTGLVVDNVGFGTISGGTLSWSGPISGTVLGGAGIAGSDLTVVNGGTIAGGQVVEGGTVVQQDPSLDFTGGSSLLSFTGSTTGLVGDVDVASGATLTLQVDHAVTFQQSIAASGGLVVKAGSGTLTLDLTSSSPVFSGTLRIDDGTVAVANGYDLPQGPITSAGGRFELNGGTLEVTQGGFSNSGSLVILQTSDLQVDSGVAAFHALSGSGLLGVTGPGALEISGFNYTTGELAIVGGSVIVDGNGVANKYASQELGTGPVLLGGKLETIVNGSNVAFGNSLMVATGAVVQGDNATTRYTGTISDADGGSPRVLVVAGSGTVEFGNAANTYKGGTAIAGGILKLDSAGAAGQGAITFGSGSAPAGSLVLGSSAVPIDGVFGNMLDGFRPGDSLDLLGFAYASAATVAYSAGMATVRDASGDTASFLLGGSSAQSGTLQLADDGVGGTLISVACFVAGTRIRTVAGERPVESLAIGDEVVTAEGATKPIRWLGRRSYSGRFLRSRAQLQPILICAGALANGVPHRDLYVSPNHAMVLDGVLIAAADLVNGTTIVRDRQRRWVDYIHIELEEHDLILAEGAVTETFVDDDSRRMFHNAGEYADLYPDAVPVRPVFCLPRLSGGPIVQAVRDRLARRVARQEAEAAA